LNALPADRGLHRAIWAIALPSILTNVATALFGIADLWVIGQLGQAEAQAGVELGAKFMMALLIVFNFLRTGTIALTAQAAGRGDDPAMAATLVRAVGIALLIGFGLLTLMPVAIPLGLELLHARGGVAEAAGTYVGIRYWGGLLWLVNAAMVGWLIGRRRVREILIVEIVANILHIGLDVLFVLVFGWGVAGVAWATLLSEALKLAAVAWVVAREEPAAFALGLARRRETWAREPIAGLFRLNRDLFLRTLLLTGAILLLVRDGAFEGAVVLAANGILYQLVTLSTMILDGFESAAQVLCGEAVGARDRARFERLVRAILLWGLGFGTLIGTIYALFGAPLAASFSTNPEVIEAALHYLPWLAVLPVLGVASYVFDGVYVGATWTRAMLATMGVAFAAYALLLLVTGPLGNHGLWLAFSLFLVSRAAGQALLLPRLTRATFADTASPNG
jgi:multidrug resistance protein, MATE family